MNAGDAALRFTPSCPCAPGSLPATDARDRPPPSRPFRLEAPAGLRATAPIPLKVRLSPLRPTLTQGAISASFRRVLFPRLNTPADDRSSRQSPGFGAAGAATQIDAAGDTAAKPWARSQVDMLYYQGFLRLHRGRWS